jgi:hypothetical protein
MTGCDSPSNPLSPDGLRPVTQQYCCVTGRSNLLIVRYFPTFLFMPTVKWKLYPCVPVVSTVYGIDKNYGPLDRFRPITPLA